MKFAISDDRDQTRFFQVRLDAGQWNQVIIPRKRLGMDCHWRRLWIFGDPELPEFRKKGLVSYEINCLLAYGERDLQDNLCTKELVKQEIKDGVLTVDLYVKPTMPEKRQRYSSEFSMYLDEGVKIDTEKLKEQVKNLYSFEFQEKDGRFYCEFRDKEYPKRLSIRDRRFPLLSWFRPARMVKFKVFSAEESAGKPSIPLTKHELDKVKEEKLQVFSFKIPLITPAAR